MIVCRGVGSEVLSLPGRPLKRKKKSELTALPDLLGPGSEPRDPQIIPSRYLSPCLCPRVSRSRKSWVEDSGKGIHDSGMKYDFVVLGGKIRLRSILPP